MNSETETVQVSSFRPLDSCSVCANGISFIVPTSAWPCGTVALTCYACGRVLKYVDNLLIMSPRQAVAEFRPRPWVVKRYVSRVSARQPSSYEVARQLVRFGKDLGLSAEDIAIEADLQPEYVERLAGGR